MPNEFIFLTQLLLLLLFLGVSVRLGPLALTALIALQAVLANLFVTKQITLFSLTVTASDAFSVGSFLALNLLQEYFGKENAKKAIQASFFSLLFFTFFAKLHLIYHPSSVDTTQSAFETVLSSNFRITVASMSVYFFVQQIDLHLYSWMKKKGISLRMGLTLLLSQFLDTVLFSFLGLYGLIASIGSVIFVSYLIKCCVILFSSSITPLFKRWKVAP